MRAGTEEDFEAEAGASAGASLVKLMKQVVD